MKDKLGTQRPLDIREFRAKKRPGIVSSIFMASALLVVAGLVIHLGWRIAEDGARIALPVAVGIGGALAAWAFVAAFPEPYGR